MIFGHLNRSESFRQLLTHDVWRRAFDSLLPLTPQSHLGIRRLDGEEMLLNVHEYQTRNESDCCWESHQHTIDIQYVIDGGEFVDWTLSDELTPSQPYDASRDVQNYLDTVGKSFCRLPLFKGYFAVFFPCDAHRPQLSNSVDGRVYKAVVKIDTRLLRAVSASENERELK